MDLCTIISNLKENTMKQDILRKILIVDDDPIAQIALANILGEEFSVTTANNGKEALGLDPSKFDIVLMDINMPELNGVETTKLIRADHPKTPIIVGVTANVNPKLKNSCIAIGMNEVLEKPVLLETIKKLVKHYFV